MKKTLITLLFVSLTVTIQAQSDAGLQKMVSIVAGLQKAAGSKKACNAAVDSLSRSGAPKITLMDDAGTDEHEYRGRDTDKFRLNAVVTYAYNIQNGANLSRGNYFDSRQRGIKYSLIEKSIKPRSKAVYSLTGHSGPQELVVMPFKPDADYAVTVSYEGRPCTPAKSEGYVSFKIDRVESQGRIEITIENHATNFESFALMNYNSRK